MFFCRGMILGLLLGRTAVAQQYPIAVIPNGTKIGERGVMVLDSSDRLWFGIEDGLTYFDGSRFLSMDRVGYPKAFIRTIAEDNEGAIWIAPLEDYIGFPGQASSA